MADKKISQLSAATALTGAEIVPVVQGGATVKTTTQDIADLAGAPYTSYVARITQNGGVDQLLENTTGLTFTWVPNIMLNTLSVNLGTVDYYKVYVNATTINYPQVTIVEVAVDGGGDTIVTLSQDTFTGGPAEQTAPIHLEIRIYP